MKLKTKASTGFFLFSFFDVNNLRDRSFVSGLGLTFISAVMTGVAVGAGGSGAKSIYVSGTLITTFPF